MSSEVIDDPRKTLKLFIRLIQSGKFEVLLILPTINAFKREHKIGIIDMLADLASLSTAKSPDRSFKNHESYESANVTRKNVVCKILTPTDDGIEQIIRRLGARDAIQQGTHETSPIDNGRRYDDGPSIHIRRLESPARFNVTTVTIVVVDRSSSLVMEKIDDSKEDFVEAVGLATYSTSGPTVISYVSIFENFWNQIELYEKLKVHDKMQREFINIASHELKTPVQSILGYSELLPDYPDATQRWAEGIRRNAIRLEKLTNTILDVSRIDSNRLSLSKERFNIKEKITNVVNDLTTNHGVKIKIMEPVVDPIFVEGDKVRIYEVVSNLLTNAIKFDYPTSDNIRHNTHKNKNNIFIYTDVRTSPRREVVVTIKDRGIGISPDIQEKLFSKFTTGPEGGMGLGLFISRGIIEAHNGKIWAENNQDGRGASFSFSLPIS